MTRPTELSATEILKQLEAGRLSAVEVCQDALDRAEEVEPHISSLIRLDRTYALQDAETVDYRRENQGQLGCLAGVPLVLKDVVCTRGQPTTCGSRMLEDFIPPYDATVVEKVKQADCILLGKANMDEFAMGSSTESSYFGVTRNPWDLNRVPGGSSGGSAACVAAGIVPWALGSDTGGSIRQPAAYCGITGLKPTYGRVSRYGLVAFASSLDQLGPMARTVEDCALLLDVISGHDPRDSTSADQSATEIQHHLNQRPQGLRLGIVPEHFGDGLDPEIRAALEEAMRVFQSLGATVVEVPLPHAKYAIATYYLIACSEASSNLARYDGVHYGFRCDESTLREQMTAEGNSDPGPGRDHESLLVRMYRETRRQGFGPEVKRRIMLGTYALSAGYYDAYYRKASQVRRRIREDLDSAFTQVDLILGPVTPTPPFRIGERRDDPLAMYLGDLYTVTANLAGIPALALPCGFTASGLPIGLQLQAPPFAELLLLQAGHWFQQVTDWHQRRPPLP